MTTTAEGEGAWIPAKPRHLLLVLQNCPELARPVTRTDTGDLLAKPLDEGHEIPLWLSALCQAWQGAIALPACGFGDLLDVVRGNVERQRALGTMARLGVVSASDALVLIEQWEAEGESK